MPERYDIVIVGAGMAGASLAAALGRAGPKVLMIEAEDYPGYHTTGRSAAFWQESYGGPGVQPLTTASGAFLRDNGFLHPRGCLTLAHVDDVAALDRYQETFAGLGIRISRLRRDEMEQWIPGLRSDWTAATLEPDCSDIKVAELHQHYLTTARRAGVLLETRAPLMGAERDSNGWCLRIGNEGRTVLASVIVNAAGAWADSVAQICGAQPLGITPLRRTVAQIRTEPAPPDTLPVVFDVAQTFYFRPESGRLWLSPHDETPSPPCDAAPEELDVAIAIDRFEHVVSWKVGAVERKWAGLRSFAPDRLPVYGYDPVCEGFFWFAGQGGFGIQTAPAAASLGAALLTGIGDSPVDPAPYAPVRLTS